MPVTILRQQGIHPNPGPRKQVLDSIMDDECWVQWGITSGSNADSQINDNDMRAQWYLGSPVLPGPLEVCDLTRMDDSDDSSHDDADHADGFSDWYGDRSSIDHLCRGRREGVIGIEWIDASAYFEPPPSLIQAALNSGARRSADDPSCKKLHRWQLEDRLRHDNDVEVWQDELHQTWVDEISQ